MSEDAFQPKNLIFRTKSGNLVRGLSDLPPQPFQDLANLNTDRIKY